MSNAGSEIAIDGSGGTAPKPGGLGVGDLPDNVKRQVSSSTPVPRSSLDGVLVVPLAMIEEEEQAKALALLIEYSDKSDQPFALGVGGLQFGQPVVWLGGDVVALVSEINSRPCPNTKPSKLSSLDEAKGVADRLQSANPGFEMFPAVLYLEAHNGVGPDEALGLFLELVADNRR